MKLYCKKDVGTEISYSIETLLDLKHPLWVEKNKAALRLTNGSQTN